MDRAGLRRLIRGPIATVPTAFEDDYKLDLGVMSSLTEWWVENGVIAGKGVIKVAAAMGEGPDLNDDEWPRLLETVVDAAAGKAAIVCGLRTKNTLHTIEDAKRASDLGAIGVQIDLPIFHHPTEGDIIRYFTDISGAIDVGIVVYNTWWFGAESVSINCVHHLAALDKVVALKWSVPPDRNYDDMRDFASELNVIDNGNQPVRNHKNGGEGYINHTMNVWPAHDLRLWDLLEHHRYDEAQALWDKINGPLAELIADTEQYSGGYRVSKAMMRLTGHPMGEPRPPTLPLTPEEERRLRALMATFDWPIFPY